LANNATSSISEWTRSQLHLRQYVLTSYLSGIALHGPTRLENRVIGCLSPTTGLISGLRDRETLQELGTPNHSE
jgi:hypothetical protein